jgi:hypothetical protein
MHLDCNTKLYKKIDGIYSPEEKLSKWQKFWLGLGKFMVRGLAGKWEINFKIKF